MSLAFEFLEDLLIEGNSKTTSPLKTGRRYSTFKYPMLVLVG
jgi:hypothetical protein